MSVVLTRPPAALYREEQNFEWWVYAALLTLVILSGASLRFHDGWRAPVAPVPFRWPALHTPVYIAIGIVLPLIVVCGFLHMSTEVSTDACCVSFGWVPSYRRVISLAEVKAVEIVRYHAIREHGFWGIRTTRDGERVLTARGDRAVRLHLSDGSRVLIGTQRPEDLARAIESGRVI